MFATLKQYKDSSESIKFNAVINLWHEIFPFCSDRVKVLAWTEVVKPVLREHFHERPSAFKDHTSLAERVTPQQLNLSPETTFVKRPYFIANGLVFQDKFYSTLYKTTICCYLIFYKGGNVFLYRNNSDYNTIAFQTWWAYYRPV